MSMIPNTDFHLKKEILKTHLCGYQEGSHAAGISECCPHNLGTNHVDILINSYEKEVMKANPQNSCTYL
jgi:hypothetical protein